MNQIADVAPNRKNLGRRPRFSQWTGFGWHDIGFEICQISTETSRYPSDQTLMTSTLSLWSSLGIHAKTHNEYSIPSPDSFVSMSDLMESAIDAGKGSSAFRIEDFQPIREMESIPERSMEGRD